MFKQSKSSFNGIIEEIPGVIVDNFENPDRMEARAYFLSHCHTDHVQGLYSKELLNYLKITETYIYTTELNAAIIEHEKIYEELMDFVQILKKGSTLITLPSRQNLPEEYVTVKSIPAGHCVGASMYLFKTPSKNILYTGDFRININDMAKYKAFHENDVTINIETMYIDTTFLNKEYENFPKRSESVDMLMCNMKKWLNNNDGGVALHTSAKYGYEYVFNEIYKKLNMKVFVGDHWKFYSTIQHLVPGVTNNEKETRIHLCKKRDRDSHGTCTKEVYKTYLYVHLSARKWTNFEAGTVSVERQPSSGLDVCFATHCSRNELLYFVNYLSPKKIVGFPYPWFVKRKNEMKSYNNKRCKVKN